MITEEDLSAHHRTGAQLIDAIWQAYREGRRDLQDRIASLLEHDDPVVREEAIGLLLVRWADVRYRARALSLLASDTDFGVRSSAVMGLASVSTPATRKEDLQFLLQVLRDPAEDLSTRRAAYDWLLLLGGRRDFPSLQRNFDPERDVDWEWLATLDSIHQVRNLRL